MVTPQQNDDLMTAFERVYAARNEVSNLRQIIAGQELQLKVAEKRFKEFEAERDTLLSKIRFGQNAPQVEEKVY